MTYLSRPALVLFALLSTFSTLSQESRAQDSGQIAIVAILCNGPGASGELTVVESVEAASVPPENCPNPEVLPASEVALQSVDDESNVVFATVDSDTGAATATLPPGDYLIPVMTMPGTTPSTLTVVSGQSTAVQILIFTQFPASDYCGSEFSATSGAPDEPLVDGGPVLRWSVPLPFNATDISQPAIDSDTFVLGLSDFVLNSTTGVTSALVAFDVNSGAMLWCQEMSQPFLLSNFEPEDLVAASGAVVAAFGPEDNPEQGETAGFDMTTGEELWRFAPTLTELSELGSTDDVVVGVLPAPDQDSVVALDPATGVEQWRFTPDETMQPGAPVISDGLVFLPVERFGSSILAIDLKTGAEHPLPDLDIEGEITNIAAADGQMYVSTYSEVGGELMVVALDIVTGAELWQMTGPTTWIDSIVAGDQSYVVMTPDLLALDPATGDERWRFALSSHWDSSITMPPVVFGEQVVGGEPTGSGSDGEQHSIDLVGIAAENGSELWRLPLIGHGFFPAPVVAGDALIVIGTELMALEVP